MSRRKDEYWFVLPLQLVELIFVIVWACGYMVEESYFLAKGKVEGVTKLNRARKFVGADDSFANGMFEKRSDNIARRRLNMITNRLKMEAA